jgi:O-antigen ligase
MKQVSFNTQSFGSSVMSKGIVSVILVAYILMSVGLAYAMPLFPPIGLIGVIAINLIVLLFLRSRFALPIYIVLAGPSVTLSLSSSGILSRLYIGNLLFGLAVVIWVLQTLLPERKSGHRLIDYNLLLPFTILCIIALISIVYSRLFPDPQVPYVYPHATVPLIVVNLAEMLLLIGLPMFLILVPGVVRKVSDVRLVIAAYTFLGSTYALGSVFAGPLNLYGNHQILGNRRPVVWGETSSGLGSLILLFSSLCLGQALYTKGRACVGWSFLFLISCAGVVMTFGRESWVGLFLVVLAMVGLRTKNWMVLVVPLVTVLIFLLTPGATDFFNPTKTYGADRLHIYADAISIWQRSPIFGVGAGNYQFFDRFYGTDKVGVAHNEYLQVLAEMGIQGLLCLVWIIVVIGMKALKIFNNAKSRLGKSLSLTYLGYYVSIIFGGLFTSIFLPSAAAGGGTEPFVSSSYRWLLLGLVLSIPNWENEAVAMEQEEAADTKMPGQLDRSDQKNTVSAFGKSV